MNRKQMKAALEHDETSKVYKYFKGLKNEGYYGALGDLKLYINHSFFCRKYQLYIDQKYDVLWNLSLFWMVQNEMIGQKYDDYASFKKAFYQSRLEFYLFLETIDV